MYSHEKFLMIAHRYNPSYLIKYFRNIFNDEITKTDKSAFSLHHQTPIKYGVLTIDVGL